MGFALYRWAKRREEFMLFLTLALWIDSLAALAQKRILVEIGAPPNGEALYRYWPFLQRLRGCSSC